MRKLDDGLKKALEKVKYFLLDLDGTLYLDGVPIGDMANTLNYIRSTGRKLIYLTNNSSKSTDKYVDRLTKIGFYKEGDLVYSSGTASAEYFNRYYAGKKVFVLGTESFKAELIKNGVNVTEGLDADIALLAYDTELTYKKLCDFVKNIHRGAKYIATHPDNNCPAEEVYIPDAGSFIKMIETSNGFTPELIIGKPNSVMGKNLKVRFNEEDDKAFMMVGDRLYTDIAFGINSNFYSMLVLSGETTEDMLETSPVNPSFILESFNDVKNYL
ncbi:MAG: HAD-IIA family hydrolase [Clostridia bacterium]|nr:HAD-IIA family hydrolase [Clostridia bacterium]